MPRNVNPNRALLPTSRRELAVLLLKCRAKTLTDAATMVADAPRFGRSFPDVARDLHGQAVNITGPNGDTDYVLRADADTVDTLIVQCLPIEGS